MSAIRAGSEGGVRGLADAIHERMCQLRKANGVSCIQYRKGSGGHWEAFQLDAARIWARLEPEIGAAGVELVVAVVLEELW